MAQYILHSIFHLVRLLYVRPETFGPYYVYQLHTYRSSHTLLKHYFINTTRSSNMFQP